MGQKLTHQHGLVSHFSLYDSLQSVNKKISPNLQKTIKSPKVRTCKVK